MYSLKHIQIMDSSDWKFGNVYNNNNKMPSNCMGLMVISLGRIACPWHHQNDHLPGKMLALGNKNLI